VINDFCNYIQSIGTSENYQNQNLKASLGYEKILCAEITFYGIQNRKKKTDNGIPNTKIKSNEIDQIRNRLLVE
jgi:hypothetical protein